jgi:hypothetical protein
MTTKTILVAVLVTLAAGCGSPPSVEIDPAKVMSPLAHSDDAAAALVEFYGLSPAPEVYWYSPDCHDGHGFTDAAGLCVQGETYGQGDVVLSPYWPLASGLISDSAMAHEFAHVASIQRGEGRDTNHQGHFFAPGGELDQAYDMLVSKGL